MRITLPNQWCDKLANLPETAMGSQHVDIVLSSGYVIYDIPVFNCQECVTKEKFDPTRIIDIKLHRPD